MKIIYIVILFLSLPFISLGQIDTQKIACNAKIWLIPESQYFFMSCEDIEEFVRLPLGIKLIKSKGFRYSLVFFEIPHQVLGRVTINHDEFAVLETPIPQKGDNFIMAYDTVSQNLYKICGFVNSDLGFLLKSDYFTNCGRKRKKYKCLWIEGVELKEIIRKYNL